MKGFNMALVLSILLLLASCGNENITSNAHTNEDTTSDAQTQVTKEITLGYCPTMEGLAQEMEESNNIRLVPFDYTAQGLQALNNDKVDAVLVGRLAGKNEVGDVHEIRLKEGLTLVGREKKLIHVDELQHSTVHTAYNKEIVNAYLPDTEDVVFHDSPESAIREGIDDIVLINWTAYTDSLGLVIPVDSEGQKIARFRIPVLYSYNKKYIEKLVFEYRR